MVLRLTLPRPPVVPLGRTSPSPALATSSRTSHRHSTTSRRMGAPEPSVWALSVPQRPSAHATYPTEAHLGLVPNIPGGPPCLSSSFHCYANWKCEDTELYGSIGEFIASFSCTSWVCGRVQNADHRDVALCIPVDVDPSSAQVLLLREARQNGQIRWRMPVRLCVHAAASLVVPSFQSTSYETT